MKKNVWFLLSAVIGLAFVVVLPVALDNSFLNDGTALAIYLLAKILFGVLYVAVVLCVCLKDLARTVATILVSVVAFAQFIPLFVRLLFVYAGSVALVISIILIFVALIACVVLFALAFTSSKKMLARDEKA